jgi:hypothetical protein
MPCTCKRNSPAGMHAASATAVHDTLSDPRELPAQLPQEHQQAPCGSKACTHAPGTGPPTTPQQTQHTGGPGETGGRRGAAQPETAGWQRSIACSPNTVRTLQHCYGHPAMHCCWPGVGMAHAPPPLRLGKGTAQQQSMLLLPLPLLQPAIANATRALAARTRLPLACHHT